MSPPSPLPPNEKTSFKMLFTTSFSLLLTPLALSVLLSCSQAHALSLFKRHVPLLASDSSGVSADRQQQFEKAKHLCEPASDHSGILLPVGGSTLRINEPFEFFFCSPTFFKSSSYGASVLLFPLAEGGGEVKGSSALPSVGQVLARNLTVSNDDRLQKIGFHLNGLIRSLFFDVAFKLQDQHQHSPLDGQARCKRGELYFERVRATEWLSREFIQTILTDWI
jgi:hypothetical protein